uniref:Uncharacterized protein LOC111100402 n=1 Tax=Crassostrea virginica TaxID=6565 RepID=A0A8B8A9U4_CRAVI|nr:uncharacterized protein LOC111100402 [Crassostrea virginica]XP_022287934.1 uncharacterized protein LOC111100402 [Crassostrea virginica]XP_022287935.1 uncharacterized protein LOC111100402 [Crassostrea virginica]
MEESWNAHYQSLVYSCYILIGVSVIIISVVLSHVWVIQQRRNKYNVEDPQENQTTVYSKKCSYEEIEIQIPIQKSKAEICQKIDFKQADAEIEDLETRYIDLSDLDDNSSSDESTHEEQHDEVDFIIETPEETNSSYYRQFKSRKVRNQSSFSASRLKFTDDFSLAESRDKVSKFGKKQGQYPGQSPHLSRPCNLKQEQERTFKVFSDDTSFDDDFESGSYFSSGLYSSFNLNSGQHGNRNENLHVSQKVQVWDHTNPPSDEVLLDTEVNVVIEEICSHYDQSQELLGKPRNSTEDCEGKIRMYSPETLGPGPGDSVDIGVNMCIPATHGQSQFFSRKEENRQGRSTGKSEETWEAAVFPGFLNMDERRCGKKRRKRRNQNRLACSRGENRSIRRSLREIINWQISLRRNTTTMYDIQIGTSSERIALHEMAQGASSLDRDGLEDTNRRMVVDGTQLYSGPNRTTDRQNGVQESFSQGFSKEADNVVRETEEREGARREPDSAPLLNAPGADNLFYSSTETLSSFFNSVSLSSVEEDESFSYEWIRLKTFTEWPLMSIFSTTLARNGWVALGQGDKARCYSCHVVHEGWNVGDSPEKYHGPNCRFMRGQSSNVPIFREPLSQCPTPRPIYTDHQQRVPDSEGLRSSGGVTQGFPRGEGRTEPQETQSDSHTPQGASYTPQETPETSTAATFSRNHRDTQRPQNDGRLPTTDLVAAPTLRTSPLSAQNQNSAAAIAHPAPESKEAQLEALKKDPMGINFDRPKYPTYAILAVRISSFTAWPASMTQTPRDMAIAGFFFAGYGDYTRCFFCGGGLRNWEPGDDSWVEHARWFPKCAFVRQNRGQDFIDLVQRRAAELEEQRNEQSTGNTQTTTNTNTGEELSEQAKEEKVMRSPAVTTIKEMGYSEDRIKAAIFTLKQRLPKGKHKVSAHDILEVIFELNQSESSSPINQSESVAENSSINTGQSNSVMENSAYYSGGHSNLSEERKLQSANDSDSAEAANSEKEAEDEASGLIPNPIFDELTSLKMENSSLKDQILCKICMEKNVSIAFLPCGHLACCEDCSPAMRKCPICRQFVRGTVKTFLV